MPNRSARSGLSLTLTVPMRTLAGISLESWASMRVSCLQGTQFSDQKSTTAKPGCFSTSASKFASVPNCKIAVGHERDSVFFRRPCSHADGHRASDTQLLAASCPSVFGSWA